MHTRGTSLKVNPHHTHYGSFEWRVMPFSLSNAPAAFQRLMNSIFADLLDICVLVYLNDILIYSDNSKDHERHVCEVLCRLRNNKLYACADKCSFHKDRVKYLGYILAPSGFTMDNNKVKVIQDWPEPQQVKDVQSFLGFTNFYRRFVHNHSDLTVPLTWLTRKGTPWSFSDSCRTSFETLKKAFITALVLAQWEPRDPLIVETDTPDYALGAILSTITPSDNQVHLVAFHSWTFTSTELNYDVHDKELLAIFEAFKCWRHYLEGSPTPVNVIMDHKNLEYFSTTKLLTWRQARCLEFLSQFNLVIHFHPRKLGAKLDSLTR